MLHTRHQPSDTRKQTRVNRARAPAQVEKTRDWSDTPSRKGISGWPRYRGGCCQQRRPSVDNCALLLTSDDWFRSLARIRAIARGPRRNYQIDFAAERERASVLIMTEAFVSGRPGGRAQFPSLSSSPIRNKVPTCKYKSRFICLIPAERASTGATRANFPLIPRTRALSFLLFSCSSPVIAQTLYPARVNTRSDETGDCLIYRDGCALIVMDVYNHVLSAVLLTLDFTSLPLTRSDRDRESLTDSAYDSHLCENVVVRNAARHVRGRVTDRAVFDGQSP